MVYIFVSNNSAELTCLGTGTSVALQGELSTSGSNIGGNYSIDSSTPTPFTVTPRKQGPYTTDILSNEPYFNITDLSPGEHSLEVTYTGPSSLGVDRLIVTLPPIQSSISAPTTVSASPSETTSSSPESSTSLTAKRTPVGTIVGSAIGGVLLLSFIALSFFILRQRRIKRKGLRTAGDLKVRPNLDPTEYFAVETTTFSPSDLYSTVFPPNRTSHTDSFLTASAVMSQYGPSEGSTAGTSDVDLQMRRLSDMKSMQSLTLSQGRVRNTQMMLHTDSGVRMGVGPEEEVEVIDVPPNYTPS